MLATNLLTLKSLLAHALAFILTYSDIEYMSVHKITRHGVQSGSSCGAMSGRKSDARHEECVER